LPDQVLQRKIIGLSTRLKFAVVSVLLFLALISMLFAAASTAQAYQQFEQEHQQFVAGDVGTVSFWMTVPYVAHVYHVPADCLSQALALSTPFLRKRANLRLIAAHYKEPVSAIIRRVQQIVTDYRQHKNCTVSRADLPVRGSPYA
jgi:hypothetical protein